MRVSLFTITTRERENERDGALMRKYPERERVRLPLQVFLRKKKRKKKLGHWVFRVFVSDTLDINSFGVRKKCGV